MCVCLDICVATLDANQQLRDCPCCNLLLVASNLFLRGAAYLARKPLGHQQHQHRNNKYGTVYFFLKGLKKKTCLYLSLSLHSSIVRGPRRKLFLHFPLQHLASKVLVIYFVILFLSKSANMRQRCFKRSPSIFYRQIQINLWVIGFLNLCVKKLSKQHPIVTLQSYNKYSERNYYVTR